MYVTEIRVELKNGFNLLSSRVFQGLFLGLTVSKALIVKNKVRLGMWSEKGLYTYKKKRFHSVTFFWSN